MKKLILVIMSAMMLTGCSSRTPQFMERMAKESEESVVLEKSHYNKDKEIIKQTELVGEVVKKEYDKKYTKDDYMGYGFRIAWDAKKFLEEPLSRSVVGEKLDEVFPGIKVFMKEVEAETEDKSPQSIVINNAVIKMNPIQCYDQDQAIIDYNHEYLSIKNIPIELIDSTFQSLAQYVPEDLFFINEPYETGENQLLRFSTPAFDYRSINTFNKIDGTSKEQYYEPNALAYQLYTHESSLRKVRVVLKKLENEQLPAVYFDPLKSWCEKVWQMTPGEQSQVLELIGKTSEGKEGSHKGSFGDYEYTYKARDYTGYDSKKETIIELVISSK